MIDEFKNRTIGISISMIDNYEMKVYTLIRTAGAFRIDSL